MAEYSVTSTIEPLTAKLFEAEERRLAGLLTGINRKNKVLCETKSDGFIHRGMYYLPKDAAMVRSARTAKTALHLSLIDGMESFLKERLRLNGDKKLISQVLFNLLSPCLTIRAIRNALPECLVSCVLELTKLPRTDPEAYTIQDNPRALRQYELALPKMEIFVATRLLY